MIMLKTRMQEWLLEHPEVLTLAFVVVLTWQEYAPDDVSASSGASSYMGP